MVQQLHGESTSLSSEEAARRLVQTGPNALPQRPRRRLPSRIIGQLRDPMILLLMAAGVITALIGDASDMAVIAAVIVLNTTLGVTQEIRAERAITALGELAAPQATVLRDGTEHRVAAELVVPGDWLRLEAGDVVPADATLLEVHQLQLDEAAMSGESVPLDKDQGEEVLAGTVVTRGRAIAQVSRTGAESGLGKIAALIAASPVRPTPLQQRLSRLSRLLVVATLSICAVVLLLGVLRGRPLVDMAVVAVSLAVAAVPESLPAVVTVALALGARRMAHRSAIVRWLPAVETLGSVTVLASDKTGTLTEGRMVAERAWTPTATYAVSGTGYAPDGSLTVVGGALATESELSDLLLDAVLCNDSQLHLEDGGWSVFGDPLEGALLAVAMKGGVQIGAVREAWPRAGETPFDAQRRRMTTLHTHVGGPSRLVCKGAPETVLPLTRRNTEAAQITAAFDAAHRLATEGYRVIAVAHADVEDISELPDLDELEPRLALVGLLALADPPRETARDVVDACRAAGVRLVLITGDHPATARAIADRLGIGGRDPTIATGEDVAAGRHVDRVDEIDVYARTLPEQKVDILSALQRRGHIVAMTGDGVNDAPALRRADIGVAMGKDGTEVARQASALVLADDDLRSVVAAVEEGRRIFTNIRSFLRYGLSGGLAEVLVMLVGPFVGIPIPLVPAQILWINMLTHGLPGVAFGAEPLEPSVMSRPSRSPQRSVMGDGLGVNVALTGLLIAGTTLVAGALANAQGEHSQTWIFVTLGLAQLGVALALRAPRRTSSLSARALELAVAGAAVLQLGAIWLTPLQGLLDTVPIAPLDLLLISGLAAIPGIFVGVERRVARRSQRDAKGNPAAKLLEI